MNNKNFTTHGNEPVEARIVAWVLGEASAFEIDELERLCREQPELAVFKRRIEAIHGLAREAHDHKDDAQWKLSIKKRSAIEGLIGAEDEVAQDLARDHRVGQSGRRALLAIAACLVLTVVVSGLMGPALLTQSKSQKGLASPESAIHSDHAFENFDSRSGGMIPPSDVAGGFDHSQGKDRQQLAEGVTGRFREQDREQESLSNGVTGERERKASAEMDLNGLYRWEGKVSRPLKPKSPSAATSEVITSATLSGVEVPIPDVEVNPSVTFGASRDFGLGWGIGDAPVAEKRNLEAEPMEETRMLAGNGSENKSVDPIAPATTPSFTLRHADEEGLGGGAGAGAEMPQAAGESLDGASRREVTGSMRGSNSADDFFSNDFKGGQQQNGQYASGYVDGDKSRKRGNGPATDANRPGSRPAGGGEAAASIWNSLSASDPDVQYEKSTTRHAEMQKRMKNEKPAQTEVAVDALEAHTGFKRLSGLETDPASLTPGARSGDFMLGGEDIDGLLSDVREGGLRKELADKLAADEVHYDAEQGELLRSNPALTKQNSKTVREVNELSVLADGQFMLGKYDDAKASFEKVLEVDPYNVTARRGLERVAAVKSDYTRAAYDHTRSELLQQVDAAWGIEIPEEDAAGNLSGLAKREMIRRQNDVALADQKLKEGRKAYAEGDFSNAADHFKDALQLIPDAPLFAKHRAVYEAHAAAAQNELQNGKKLKNTAKKRPVPTGEETVAAEEPYSTFSLNINDASFRVAQAALARGEMPDPAGIKVEQFYNAVDYGDPAPAAGQPVACNIEQSAHPIIPGRNLVRVALKTASEGRSQGQALRLTLLIDQSGSMAREDRRAAMVEALDGLRGLLNENDQVNVIGFARTPRLLGEALKGNQGQLGQLVNIEANEGGTNLEEALKLGEQLAERHLLEGAQNRIVLFTDGAANLGDADPESLADKIKELRQNGIAFDVAGIVADGLNDELLGEMARHGNGRYYVVGKGQKDRFAEQLAGAFRPAAENVKVQVHFNPERVGRYKLIGFEKDRLNKEDFRNDAVDAAELAAEEAGVAIYQVETLPEGGGEIGEVSVRFRDVASGEMVERSWTIANEISTPALDQARPSMQLATLAMLAGEKLKGGPLSDAVNFNDMVEVIAQVSQHFKGDPKAAEMLQMIEQLK